MEDSHLSSIQKIFHDALDRLPDERGRFLDQACGDDADLRVQVERLLLAHSEAGEFLASPTAGLGDESTSDEQPGVVIGHYKLLQPIGEGGCGSVWLAEQKEPVRRKVALKVIKRGMDTRQVIARFEAERQALAMMDHPNIAKVLDGGETPNGRPYFAMELVRGIPITKFCDQQRLDTRGRLELFRKVCHAVQHAHQKGVIHRDLKPSNVLVTLHDGVPVPKVIDFGLAKAIHQPLTEKTMFTRLDQMMGTPEYMAPEQAEMSGLDVDTRADIYSLGVLLYELLTGGQPFGDLSKRGHLEMLRVIREEDPQKPSTRISTLGDQVLEVAKLRHTAPKMLGRLVRGDLDWIAMKTLEKDRTRRYETADALAADINRHLRNEPVLAGPPSTGYRIRKYIRRHRIGVLAGAGVAASLLVGLWLAVTGFLQATKEATRAEANLNLSLEALDQIYLDVAERLPEKQGPLDKADRQLLENALKFYERFAARNSGTTKARRELARAYARAGEIHRKLGHFKQALQAFRSAAARFEALAAESPRETRHRYPLAQVHVYIGGVLMDAGRPQEALEALERSGTIVRQLLKEAPNNHQVRVALVTTLDGMALAFLHAGRLDDAEQSAQRALTICQEVADALPDNAEAQRKLADVHCRVGALKRRRHADAEPHYRQAIKILRRLSARSAAEKLRCRAKLALACQNLSIPLVETKRYKEAEPALREAVRINEQLVAERPQDPSLRADLGLGFSSLADLLTETGRFEDAEQTFRRALDNHRELVNRFPDTPNYQCKMGASLHNLADLMLRRKRYADAIPLYESAIGHQQAALKRNAQNPTYRQFLRNHYGGLAQALVYVQDPGLRDPPQAVRLAQAAVELFPEDATARLILADVQILSRNWKAGQQALKESMDLYEARNTYAPEERYRVADCCGKLLKLLMDVDHLDDAEPTTRRVLGFCKQLVKESPEDPDYQRQLGLALHNLGLLLSARKQFGQAIALYERAIVHQRAALKAKGQNTDCQQLLCKHYLKLSQILLDTRDSAQRDPARVEQLARNALKLFPKHATAWNQLGQALVFQGQQDKSITAFKKALEANPKYAAAHYNLGLSLTGTGHIEQAIPHLIKSHALFAPKGGVWTRRSAQVLYVVVRRYARSLLQKGDPVAARKVLEAGAAALPEDPRMLNALAWHLVDPEGVPEQWDFAAAVPTARKAVRCSRRKDPNILDTLAVALFRHGDIDAAIVVQKEILQVMAGRDVGSFKVADARAQLARFEAAQKAKGNKKGKSDG